MKKFTGTLGEYFQARVSPEPNTGCWLWTGYLADGYGMIGIVGHRNLKAHRAALLLAGRPPTDDEIVLHLCNNTTCVNPEHLKAGTQKENMAQASKERRMSSRHQIRLAKLRAERNSQCRGDAVPNSKLKPDDIIQIRRAYSAGSTTQKELGLRFGVTQAVVSKIVRREAWAHVH